MNRLFLYVCLFPLFVIFPSISLYGSDLIVDPIQHYVAWVYGSDHDVFMELLLESGNPLTLVKITADVTGDGQPEVLLSLYGLANGADGLMWDVYTSVPGGYRIIGGITFHPKAFYVGDFEGNGWGVVKYSQFVSEWDVGVDTDRRRSFRGHAYSGNTPRRQSGRHVALQQVIL